MERVRVPAARPTHPVSCAACAWWHGQPDATGWRTCNRPSFGVGRTCELVVTGVDAAARLLTAPAHFCSEWQRR